MRRGSHAAGRHADDGPAHTAFSEKVRFLIRTRAGDGHASAARCESCGEQVGQRGGEVVPIALRGTSVTPAAVLDSAANGVLLCGTATGKDGCYGAVQRRAPEMETKGFFVLGRTDPRLEPMTLAGSPARVWRSEDGRYLLEEPARQSAEPPARRHPAHRRGFRHG